MKRQLVVAACLFSALVAAARAEMVFSSTNEFSTVQGQDGWYYGYYDGDVPNAYTPDDFEAFPQTKGNMWIVHRGDPSGFWTSLYAVGGHPNGPVPNYYQGTEHWTVRRWVSDVSGTILIEGFIQKGNGSYGDGVTAHILKNETEIFSNRRPGNDPRGVQFELEVEVEEGDVLDFAISPNAYDMYDSTRFTVTGTLIEAPQTPVIAMVRELNAEGCVEATSATSTPVTVYVDQASAHADVVYLWSTSDGRVGQGPEFSFEAALNSNVVVFLTAHDNRTGEIKSAYEIVRASDSTAPVITIERRSESSHTLGAAQLDISVVDGVDGIIEEYTVCRGHTSRVTSDAFTGAATVGVRNPIFSSKRSATDVTVIASDAAGNTAIKTIQVRHKESPAKKTPQPEKKPKSRWFRWRGR